MSWPPRAEARGTIAGMAGLNCVGCGRPSGGCTCSHTEYLPESCRLDEDHEPGHEYERRRRAWRTRRKERAA